ncbi:MAG: hypothetical protein R3C39_00275 [Dehalococcoidia bacterium]
MTSTPEQTPEKGPGRLPPIGDREIEPRRPAAATEEPTTPEQARFGPRRIDPLPVPVVPAIAPRTEQVEVDDEPLTLLGVGLARLFRWALYAAGIVVLAGIVGFMMSRSSTPIYAAQTDIFFPLDADRGTGFLREDRRISTQLESIRSRSILGPVAARHSLEVDELERMTSVGVVGASEIIRIQVQSESTDVALAVVEDIASTYLAQLSDPGVDAARVLLLVEASDIEDELGSVNAEIADIDPADTATAPRLAELQAERTALLARQSDVEQRRSAFEVQQALLPQPSVLAEPYALSKPVAPNVIFDTARGMAVGMALATIMVAALIARTAWRD